MRKKLARVLLTVFVCFFLSAGMSAGYDPGGPIPEGLHPKMPLNYTEADVDAIVTVEAQTIAPFRDLASYGVNKSSIPSRYDCNNIKFIRYRLNNATLGLTSNPVNANYADMGFLMVPGVVEGANGFEYIARNLIYKAYKNKGLKVEVWAMDRRNNCIEDRVGADKVEAMYNAAIAPGSAGGSTITQAEEDAMMDAAIGYYYKHAAINGKTFDGWYSSAKVPYLSEFGLRMDTEDMFQIIKAMVPNQADRKKKVFVGGHSLGGMHTGLFASWDFDGNPNTLNDAGFNNTAGLFAFDSVVTPVDNAVNEVLKGFIPVLGDYGIEIGENLTWPVYEAALVGLRTGIIPRIIEGQLANAFVGSPIGPEAMTLIEAVGALAYALPDKEHTTVRKIYPFMGDDVKDLLQKFISRDQAMYDAKWPTITDFRLTNAALLGLLFDDSYSSIGMIQTSMGFMYSDAGGGVAPKGEISSLNFNSLLFGTAPQLFVPTNAGPVKCETHSFLWMKWQACQITGPGPLYRWADFDQVARPGDDYTDTTGTLTYTTYKNEGSGIQSLGRAMFKGDSNLVEWYFSVRRLVDFLAAVADWAPSYGLNTYHKDKALNNMPVIEFLAENGVIVGNFLQNNLPVNPVIIQGLNHMDPMFASANTNYRDDDDVIGMLLGWAVDNVK
ncbi:MAG: hypothetical protein NTW65_08680 [Deltaproteobacteria bacterium]|nr:hypothetical protein [Deltaproteobacteria bacterium]